MKLSQLRQLIKEEIRGVLNETSENEAARMLLRDLQKQFKNGAAIELTGNDGEIYQVKSWPMANLITLVGTEGSYTIPYKKEYIDKLKLTVNGEPVEFGEFDSTVELPSTSTFASNISGIGSNEFLKYEPKVRGNTPYSSYRRR